MRGIIFFWILSNVGWRPGSEGLDFTWDRCKFRDRDAILPNGENKDEYIANMPNAKKYNDSRGYILGKYF
jgi:hypothetical protein